MSFRSGTADTVLLSLSRLSMVSESSSLIYHWVHCHYVSGAAERSILNNGTPNSSPLFKLGLRKYDENMVRTTLQKEK